MNAAFTLSSAPRSDAPVDEKSWLPAARCGEAWALERFYYCYQAQVYALCLRMVGRPEDAKDAAQTTFVQAFRALPRFRGDANVRTWLFRIAVNESTALLRKRKYTPEPIDENTRVPSSERSPEERVAVEQALLRTREHHRTVLVLRFWEELSYEEIAAVLGITVAAVKMRLFRAREEFRRHYEGAA